MWCHSCPCKPFGSAHCVPHTPARPHSLTRTHQHTAGSYEATCAFTDFANWLVPGRLLVGRYPYVEPSRCKSYEEGEEKLQQILGTGVSTFVSLQVRVSVRAAASCHGGTVCVCTACMRHTPTTACEERSLVARACALCRGAPPPLPPSPQAEVPAQEDMRLAGVGGFMPYKSAAELIKHSMNGCVVRPHAAGAQGRVRVPLPMAHAAPQRRWQPCDACTHRMCGSSVGACRANTSVPVCGVVRARMCVRVCCVRVCCCRPPPMELMVGLRTPELDRFLPPRVRRRVCSAAGTDVWQPRRAVNVQWQAACCCTLQAQVAPTVSAVLPPPPPACLLRRTPYSTSLPPRRMTATTTVRSSALCTAPSRTCPSPACSSECCRACPGRCAPHVRCSSEAAVTVSPLSPWLVTPA
jgi:hypothetical protein